MPESEKGFWSETAALLLARTDADGRFTLHGIGAERTALLHLSEAGIADAELWIVNRAGFNPKPYNQATLENIPKRIERRADRLLLHGPDAAAVVEPEKPIRGVVKDVESGKGRPGVVVYLSRKEGGKLVGLSVKATTDAQGRYEMHGVRKAKQYMLEVKSDASTGHVACQVWADDTAGYQPIAADVPVKKGVAVTDAKGAFKLDDLVPKCKFVVYSLRRGRPLGEKGSTLRKSIVHEVKPEERLNLGALALAPMAEESAGKSPPAEQAKAQPVAATKPQAPPKDKDKDMKISGIVFDPDGKLVAGANPDRRTRPRLEVRALAPARRQSGKGNNHRPDGRNKGSGRHDHPPDGVAATGAGGSEKMFIQTPLAGNYYGR